MGISAALGAHQQALGALIAVIGSREITAGIEPARRNGKVATLTVGLSHDVSTVLGIGRRRGSQPRANTSMTARDPGCVETQSLHPNGKYLESNASAHES